MTIKDKVELILKQGQLYRDSDKELEIAYLNKQGVNLTPEQQDAFRKADSIEDIVRQRRIIQAEGKYLATAGVRSKRKERAVKHQITRGYEYVVLED